MIGQSPYWAGPSSQSRKRMERERRALVGALDELLSGPCFGVQVEKVPVPVWVVAPFCSPAPPDGWSPASPPDPTREPVAASQAPRAKRPGQDGTGMAPSWPGWSLVEPVPGGLSGRARRPAPVLSLALLNRPGPSCSPLLLSPNSSIPTSSTKHQTIVGVNGLGDCTLSFFPTNSFLPSQPPWSRLHSLSRFRPVFFSLFTQIPTDHDAFGPDDISWVDS